MPARPARRGRKTGKPRHTGNGHADLIRQLWEAAVTLRGSIEPADYKRYVLPIIFLRFLSLRYERRRHELERLVKAPGSEYYTKSPKQAAAILEDADEYRAVGAFIVPKAARWEEIVKHAQADDIKVRLDSALETLEKAYPDKLRGLLPRTYAGSNLGRESVTGLINLFSRDVFREDHGGTDLIGLVYEYFIGEFANSEGKRGGEYFTPVSIVRVLVNMLAPEQGTVFDPCCGSGGMFVQSDLFTRHSQRLSFVGQESKDFTYRLCRMNLFIHGLDGNIQLGNSYFDDRHATLKADYVLANPPFNDGAKSEGGWGADRIPDKDPRFVVGGQRVPLSPRNANTMWILHFLHHLKAGGTAGFVMATGELGNGEIARFEVRKTLVEQGYVDCIVQLTGQLFANTQIPCSLWFLARNRHGQRGYRAREGEILFIDGRKLGALIPGSRKQKQLCDDEVHRIASVYRAYCSEGRPPDVPGFCKVATFDDVRGQNYALMPGRYVGAEDGPDDDEPFEEKFPRLVKQLEEQFARSGELEAAIRAQLQEVLRGS
ncbi:MAG: SAM-dependent DNA methyltransferase [Candidatus Rokubacteria bacterium]|nr:SAM-dependent DNA methyltransferase [Candidatus Rokubacteria bacterium]